MPALKPEQVAGIMSLVAGSVPGLVPERVGVFDETGRELRPPEPEGSQLRRLTELKTLEDHLTAKAQNHLARSFGEGKTAVAISAEVDWDQRKCVIKKVGGPAESSGAVVVTQATEHEEFAGGRSREGSCGDNDAPKDSASKYHRVKVVTKKMVSETAQEIVTAQGRIKRLTVSVLVDSRLRN